MKYPEDSLQSFCKSWWQEDLSKEIKRGQLIKAYVPYVDQIPNVLVPTGRKEATQHNTATYSIGPLAIGKHSKRSNLPVAGVPVPIGEELTVYRAKKRPMLVIGGGYTIPENLRRGKPKYQTAPTILAAPFYGIAHSQDRAGYNPEFVDRVRRCEYRHYIWDNLPFGGGEESLLRLDHMQPIGDHHQTIELAGFSLTDEAIVYLEEWLHWFLHKNMNQDSMLMQIRQELLNL